MVQANHLVRAAGAGDTRQVAGGPTLKTLPLLIWELLIINSARQHQTLETQIQSLESTKEKCAVKRNLTEKQISSRLFLDFQKELVNAE